MNWAHRQLADETEEHAQQQRADVEEEMHELRERLADLRQQWEREKAGLGGVQQMRNRLAEIEHQASQLSAHIKEKQSAGEPVPESDYQQLYQLDVERKKLDEQLDEVEETEKDGEQKVGKRLLRARSGRTKSPKWSPPGPGFRSAEWSKVSGTSCFCWKIGFISGW